MPSSNLCARRKRLYQKQLDETRAYFKSLVEPKGSLVSKAGQVGAALADPALIDALEHILNAYVTCAVALDLQRLADSKVLFLTKPDERLPIGQILAGSFTLAGAKLDPENDANKRRAYNRYFDWYIDAANVAGDDEEPKSGIAAFYGRYPLIDHAVQTVTDHYQQNIRQACKRVTDDWTEINVAFFASKMTELKKIKTTGNDFHKGGKQVLILSFQLDGRAAAPGGGAPEVGRVVYKPSAVEIDCRIVGDSATVNKVSPQQYTQKQSLTEIINKYFPPGQARDGFTTRALPTYRILPYNRDKVPEAYGYIEFLTHGPELDVPIVTRERIPATVGAEVQRLDQATVAASDWITPNPTDAQVFYHQFGALMAMAMAVSLCDLHLQNVIVHDRRPHLIDLEEALKRPMDTVKQTYLAAQASSPLGNYHDPEAPALNVKGDRTSDLEVLGWISPNDSPAACVLYVSHGDSAPTEPARVDRPKDPEDAKNRRALILGLADVFGTLASDPCFGEVKDWVDALGQTIARYVPRGTAGFADNCRTFYMISCRTAITASPTGRQADSWYDKVISDVPLAQTTGELAYYFFFRGQVNAQRRGKADPWPGPVFALEHPDHVWRDFLNCDVPSFYHLLGEPDLRNSADSVVNVDTAVKWQDANMTGLSAKPTGWSADPPRPYLPEVPKTMVAAQLDALKAKWGDPRQIFRQSEARETFLRRALYDTHLIGEFERLPVNRTIPRKTAVSGS